MLKLKLQSFGHLMRRADSLEKTLLQGGKISSLLQEEKGVTEDEMFVWHYRLNGHESEQTLKMVKDREAWSAEAHRVAKSQVQLSN